MKLNLGCGTDIRPGWVNIDARPYPGVDCELDLEDGLLPFDTDSVEEVYCAHVLEHLYEWEKLVIEIYRVLQPTGLLTIRVPYGFDPCAYHVRSFLPWTLDWFIAGTGEPGPNGESLEPRVAFYCESRKVRRKLPMYWHIRHYLKLKVPFESPIGPKWEIVWRLRKFDRGIYDGGTVGFRGDRNE